MRFWWQPDHEAYSDVETRLHMSHLVLTDKLQPVIAAGDDDRVRAYLDAAGGFAADDRQRAADAPGLIAQARDIEDFRAKAAAPGPIDNAPDAAWWARQIEAARRLAPAPSAPQELHARGARHAGELLDMPVDLLYRSERHRESLLGLPQLVGEGSAEEIAAWVAGPLTDIDPAMAAEIRGDDPILLALLDEHERILTCMCYLNMMAESVPSNVYAYMAGPGADHLLPQVTRLVACAYLGAHPAVVQIDRLVERLQALAPDEPGTDPLGLAVREFSLHLEQFMRTVVELHDFGRELVNRPVGWTARLRAIFKR